MRRASLALAAVAALVALPPAAADAKPAATCKPPAKLKFERKPGATAGTLTWRRAGRVPRGISYRVYRDTAVIGQTRRTRMRVRVSIGKTYWFKVRPVTKKGRLLGCWGLLPQRMRYVLPASPGNLSVTGASGAAAHLAWSPSHRGDSRLAGYRVLRDGATFKQTQATTIDVPISNDRSYGFTVLAVDAKGRLSAAAPAVKIETGHLPPPAPANVIASDISESELTLSWAPSVPARGTISGYRIFRDGKPLRQVQGLSTRVSNLAASSSHVFTVAAVDSAGWISAASAPATVSTAPPLPSTGTTQAFLLASTDRSFADFRAHYRSIGTVYPTFFDCTASATLTGNPNAQISSWAQARGVKVLPRFNCQRSNVLNQILNDGTLRARWIDDIVATVDQNGFDGANVDFEAGYASDRSAYTSFITELASRLHAQGKLLSVAVSAKIADVANHPRSTFFDYQALAQQADTIFVMAWGIHWVTSGPGAQDDMSWWSQVLSYVSSVGQPGRFVIGMQLYGMDWPAGGGPSHPGVSYEYADIQSLIARYGATPVRDATADAWHFSYTDDGGTPHDVWYTDAVTEAERAQMAHDRGVGIGFWRLGNEDQKLWDQPQVGP